MAITAASAATMVLPLPTSPCSSRFIGLGCFMSLAISWITRRCAPVGLNGSMVLIRSRTRSSSAKAIPGSVRALARFSATPHSSQKNSSKIRRNCACVRKVLSRRRSLSTGGKWVWRMAVQRSGIPSRSSRKRGSGSSSGASSASTRSISVRRARVVSLPVAS